MKTTFVSLLALFCLLIPSFSFAELIHRQATMDDFAPILKLIHHYSYEDRKALVTFPDEIAGDVLASDLSAKKLFVTEDSETHDIISILKTYLLTKDQVLSILTDELRCIRSDSKLLKATEYSLENLEDRTQFLSESRAISTAPYESGFSPELSSQLYLYYGSAYTIPQYRGAGIQSQLLQSTLSILKGEIISIMSEQTLSEIILVYGQIDAGSRNNQMISVLSHFVKDLVQHNPVHSLAISAIRHIAYLAYKPDFKINPSTHRLEASFPPENQGLGNLVIIQLKSTIRSEGSLL